MRSFLSPLAWVALVGCAGEVETLVLYPEVPTDAIGDTMADTSSNTTSVSTADTGDVSGNTDTTDDTVEDDARIVPFEGYYELTYARVASDTCGFEEHLQSVAFSSIADRYLPQSANVQADGDTFRIEANDFGTPGPVNCLPTEDGFVCDTQTATLDYYFYAYSYAIDFTGEVVTPERIRGRANVRYLELDDYSLSVLKALGLQLSECVTEVVIEWSWADW